MTRAVRALALAAIAMVVLCGPAAAQTPQEAADWLKGLGIKLNYKDATPELVLVEELRLVGSAPALALRERVINGDFDAGPEEADEWAASEDGQDAFGRLIRDSKKR